MISFKDYTDIVNSIAKKLKTTKDAAVNALIKVQQKGIDPLKWQKHLTMLKTFLPIMADYDPIDERQLNTPQKVQQMNFYWKDLDHLASDEMKKKNMQKRFGIKNIKLDPKGKILSFESVEEEVDAHAKVMAKKGDSAETIKKMHPEITDDELKSIMGKKEDRDYKDEYKKFQSSEKMRKYRSELNKYNREKGTYGNGDGKDASHKDGKIVGMEDQSINRGRAEKSRLVGSKRK